MLLKVIVIKNIKSNNNTVWHENLMVIKFYGLSILIRQKKLMDCNFTEALITTLIVATLVFCRYQFIDFCFTVLPKKL